MSEIERSLLRDSERVVRRKGEDVSGIPVTHDNRRVARAKRAERLANMTAAAGGDVRIGPADDAFEREADAVASQVTGRLGSATQVEGAAPGAMQRKPSGSAPAATDNSAAVTAGAGSGRTLSADSQARFGSAMGRDFSQVQLHSGPQAADAAASIGAKAFTYSNHVVLGAGASESDHHTMAHELVHVAQQGAAPAMDTSASAPIASRAPGGTAYLQRLRDMASEPQAPAAGLGLVAPAVHQQDPTKAIRCMGRANDQPEIVEGEGHFPACCQRALADMRRIIESSRALQGMLAVAPLLTTIGSNPIDAAFSLLTTNWDIHQQSVRAVPVIARNRLTTVAQLEYLRHAGNPNDEDFDSDLGAFWQGVIERLEEE